MDTAGVKKEALKSIQEAKTLAELEGVFRVFLGKKGRVTYLMKTLPSLSPRERARIGKKVNEIKKFIVVALETRRSEIKQELTSEEQRRERIDFTAPGHKLERGSLHPLTYAIREIRSIFGAMGFEVARGPEIETEFHNFDALNIPVDHPARDLWDTFWLQKNSKSEKLLLRTHTSPVQIRYMETHEPPFRIIAPGKCFRYEATDASHEFQFYQVEGLAVSDDISLGHLKGVLEEFFKRFFKKNVKTRFRPGYFPFVEPGVEVDISCITCGGKGCTVCGRSGWLEMLGAGMVHPNVFKAVGYNPREWQGFAFGVGIDRLAMMKYKIDDIRLFHSGDLRFIKQF